MFTIARILEPAPGNWPRAFSIGRQPHVTAPHSHPLRQKPIRDTILLIRPDHLGDMLLTTPTVRALKKADPSLRLIGLAGPWAADVLAHLQYIWSRPVHIQTIVDDKPTMLSFDGSEHSTRTLGDSDDPRRHTAAKTR